MPQVPSSLYPSSSGRAVPPQTLLRLPQDPWTWSNQLGIAASSLVIVGSIAWVPAVYLWLYQKWKAIPPTQKRKRAFYAALLLAGTTLLVVGPQRKPAFAKRIGFRKWRIWKLWCQFVALEVWRDSKHSTTATDKYKTSPGITAIAPHGIFPFAIGIAGIPDMARLAFGKLRVMVATATYLLPLVRDIISMVHAVDASRSSVHDALEAGDRIGLIPGGIPEMFEGYPKPLTHPDDECSIVPKGFLKMALRHNIPVTPVYCFGITKLFKRLPLPDIVERISLLLRMSICLFFGVAGLPIPFRQKLFYVMGDPITTNTAIGQQTPEQENELVDQLHTKFCEELMRLFENNKDIYGWGHKTLHLISR